MGKRLKNCEGKGTFSKIDFFWKTLSPELEKVPSSASVLVRKDFRIRETLRKAAEGKNIEVFRFWERKKR